MKIKRGEFGLLIVALIWGTGYVTTKFALDGGFTALQTTTLRFLISALLLFILFMKRIISNINARTLRYGLFLGAFLYVSFYFMTEGLVYTTASKNAFITASNVVIVPFIARIFYGKKITPRVLFCSVLALVGISILSLEKDLSVNKGDVLTLICAFGFAFHILFTSVYSRRCEIISLTFIEFLFAGILSLISQLVTEPFVYNVTPKAIMGLAMVTILSTTIGFVLQTKFSQTVSGTTVALILATESVFGTIFSWLFLGEPITLKILLGSGLIFISIIISEINMNLISYIFSRKKRLNGRE